MEPPGLKPLVVNVGLAGLFEDEEEETGITSDEVKVKGENPGTTACLRGDRARRYISDFQ